MTNIEQTIKDIEKKYGKGTIMMLDDDNVTPVDVIPTGSILLDEALGVGGIPKGRVTEIYGMESSAKTTLSLQVIRECQKLGGQAAFIDAEHALDAAYAKKLGINLKALLLSQPDCGEDALDLVDMLIRSGNIDVIVIDSVAALTPRAEIEGDMGQSHMALQARLMSQALRKITGIVSKSNTSVIFINQIRSMVGIVFGNPETTTGGNALKFYSSVRIETRKGKAIKKAEEIIGNKIKIRIVKNKVAPPFKTLELDLIYGIGIDSNQEVLDMLVEKNIIEKSGAWYKHEENKFQGSDAVKDYIKENYDKFLSQIKI